MIKKILGATLLILAIGTFFWFYNHAYLEVSVANPQKGTLTYTITNLSSHKSTTIKSTASIKRLVTKGQYSVLVQQSETSAFNAVKLGGFLEDVRVQTKLSGEKERQFVGDNPASCMYYLGQRLLSTNCFDLYSQVIEHVPASSELPTYTRKVPGQVDGVVEGLFPIGQATVVVLRSTNNSGHVSYLMSNDLSLNNGVFLPNLNRDKTYTVEPYKDGFIAYDTSFDEVLYFSSRSSPPTKISLTKPKNNSLQAAALKVQGTTILAKYSTSQGEVSNTGQDKETTKQSKNGKTTIVISGQPNEYNFKFAVSDFSLCGQQKLCVISDSELRVYDIRGAKPVYLFGVAGVQSILQSANLLVAVRNDGALSLNVEQQTGSFDYTYGNDLSYCGSSPTETVSYLLCAKGGKGKSSALYINPNKINTDSIDKKLAGLIRVSAVRDVSVYKGFIYISPDLGKPQQTAHGFDYPAAVKAEANKEINDAVRTLQINTNTYKIINTIP